MVLCANVKLGYLVYGLTDFIKLYLFKDIWQVLQGKLLNWAVAYSSIHVISGSILDSDHNGLRDNDEDYNRCI